MLNLIILPKSYNYVGVFLCLRCNLNCSYCINRFGETKTDWKELSGDDWIKGLARIETREDLPITLQGGEPTMHKDFYGIVDILYYRYGKDMDLLTNGLFDAEDFQCRVSPEAFKRNAKYASIRFSFHQNTNLMGLAIKIYDLKKENFSVGIWGLKHPLMEKRNAEMKDLCKWLGIDYREKEFLDETYKEYKHPDAILGKRSRNLVMCRPSELLIAPNGDIFKCHSNLYSGFNPIANILDENIVIEDKFYPCGNYGLCNPCDVKIKTDRFQVNGHTSVEIK